MAEDMLTVARLRDAALTEMLAKAQAAVVAGEDDVVVNAEALVALFGDLDAYRRRSAEAGRPRPRVVPCIMCGTDGLIGSPCQRCGTRV